jgi:hypothetical protein
MTALVMTVATSALPLAGAAEAAPPQGKVTICHAAGKAGTTHFVELTVAFNAAFGRGGHFKENGSGKAGHEGDFVVVPATDPSIIPAGIPTATRCPPLPGAPPPPPGGAEEAFVSANKLCPSPISGTFTITIGGTARELACGQSSEPVPVPAGVDVTVSEQAPAGVTSQFNCFRAVDSQLQTIVSGPGPAITIPGTALTPGLQVFCNVANSVASGRADVSDALVSAPRASYQPSEFGGDELVTRRAD